MCRLSATKPDRLWIDDKSVNSLWMSARPGARPLRREGTTDLFALEKRIRALEAISSRLRLIKGSSIPSGQDIHYDTASVLRDLEYLAREVGLIKEDAEAVGDHRLALACVREFCRVVELIARLRGDLDEQNSTNILHVHLDGETAKRIAETYLARRRKLESPE